MTPQNITRMAREVWGVDDWKPTQVQRLERFAALAVAHEREECAKLVQDWNTAMTDKLAAAIRARGNA